MHKLKLGIYKGLSLNPIPTFTEEDLNLGVAGAAKKLAYQWAKEHKPAEFGDEVIIHLRAECAGMFVPELSQSNYKFTLGDPSVLEQFNQIAGSKAGDELTLAVSFPPGFSVERVGGKIVTFHVSLLEVIHKHPIELTDEIVRQVDPEVSGLEEFKDKLRRFVSENWLQKISEARTKSILEAIVQNSEYELDEEELKKEFEKIFASKQNDLFTSKSPHALDVLLSGNNQSLYEQSLLLAEKNVIEDLVLTEIARKENITVSPSELREAKQACLDLTGNEESYNQLFSSEEAFRRYVLKEKVLDCLWGWNPY
jgi:trigger factor